MINKIVVTITTFFLITTCVIPGNANVRTDARTEVKAALQGQVDAWNNGDLEKSMTFYWNSPEMLWISKAGVEKGYQPILEGYRKDFNDKAKMGVYTYQPLHIETLSKTSVYYVFRWKIEFNGKKMMGGVSSQIWKKINGRWLITSEHAS